MLECGRVIIFEKVIMWPYLINRYSQYDLLIDLMWGVLAMKMRHILVLLLLCNCIPMVCSAVVIQPTGNGPGWNWSGTTELHITSSGDYTSAPSAWKSILRTPL